MALESSLKNMVLVLGAVTLIGSASVGAIYQLTKDPIAQAQQQKVNLAISDVVPAFDNAPSAEVMQREIDGETVKVYPAKDASGNPVGYAIETFTKGGFGGRIDLMVGFLPDGSISDISVLSHAETPGLGDKIEKKKSDFSVQFQGKTPDDNFKMLVRKDGGDVDAITASTITSRAYVDAVQRAYRVFQSLSN